MFIDTTYQLQLKGYSETSNLYQMFDLNVQTLISSNVSKLIMSDLPTFNAKILTTSHFDYLLESLGYAYKLPMESSQTIDDTITIYKEWLFGENQVSVLNENRKKYLKVQEI